MTNSRTLAMIGAFCVGLAPLAVSPAFAQTPPEEIVVTGKYGKVPDSVQSLSQRVSYADLDLRNDKHRDILRQRVRLTARFLCDKLGEPAIATPPVPSCRDAARSEEHTSELQSLMRLSYAVFCLKNKKNTN